MPLVLKNRVKSTTTTVGTGTYTLGSAAAGYQAFSAIGDGNQTYYSVRNETDWEVGIGTYTSSGTTLSRDQIIGSSNSGAAVNWSAGTKDALCGLPSAAANNAIPSSDGSEIGTDLAGWSAFQSALNQGVQGGTLFGNNSTNGIVSTYSLVSTGGYSGGVLAPNGDIHFVPSNASVGQKISAAGVVSTYSLMRTGIRAYTGGVLAPNGDIYFIPDYADRGQKISAAGVVSTYSIFYVTAGAYVGGVLAPNGDIHFVPSLANVGQKI